MTPQSRELRTAKLEMQAIAAMFFPLFWMLIVLPDRKNPAPWWLFVATAGFYGITFFLAAVEITRMSKSQRRWLGVIRSIKTIAWGLAVAFPAVYVFSTVNRVPYP